MTCSEQEWSYLEVGMSQGASRVIGCRSIAPIRIINPRVRSSSCHVLIANYGGGMVDGDRVCLRVTCREGARLNVGSVGNMQVYGSLGNGCTQTITGRLERDTLCVFNSDPVVLHSGSRFEQRCDWDLHRDSSLLFSEWVVAGRLETGERFDFDSYVSEFTVLVDGRPLIVDRFEFRPDESDYRDPAMFRGLACLLNVYMVGLKWSNLAEVLASETDRRRDSDSRTLAAIYPVQQHGYILRALSEDRGSLTWIAEAISRFLSHEEYLGFDPAERKY
ncbi:MAG: urease accessory protein UreD [Pseudomonadota bacterium]